MSTKVIEILAFLQKCYDTYELKGARGRPNRYGPASMTLFFLAMCLKRIHAFKAMAKYASSHYEEFGFPSAPSRKTLRRWFLAQPKYVHWLMPRTAMQCQGLDYQVFRCSWAFADKSVFRAFGGTWHRKHMSLGVVPHPSIDTDASWSKSAYHGWRFGYGLHLMCKEGRFPLCAWVTTASVKNHVPLAKLLANLGHLVGIVVGDAGYRCLEAIMQLEREFGVLLQTPGLFKTYLKKPFVQWYNSMLRTAQAWRLYGRRKPSIGPLFSLIKQLFDLEGQRQLPYGAAKGFCIPYVENSRSAIDDVRQLCSQKGMG